MYAVNVQRLLAFEDLRLSAGWNKLLVRPVGINQQGSLRDGVEELQQPSSETECVQT